MHITKFSVENFRSITKANELPLYDYSILLGPNNQGKSNILKALVLVLNIVELYGLSYSQQRKRIIYYSRFSRRYYREYEEDRDYNYDRDYPLNLQVNDPEKNGTSKFIINFKLENKEKIRFEHLTNKKLKGDLRLEATLGNETKNLKIIDTENKKTSFHRSQVKIYEFLSENHQITYIEAVRDSSRTLDIVERMVSEELSELVNKREYSRLMKQIERMQKPLLDELSKGLTSSVSEFLPEIKKVYVDSEEMIRQIDSPSTTIHVDDGTDTPLELKGDGIKSLMAISILQYVTKQTAQRKNIILAIEEPESHLHPMAIRKLRQVLEEISTKNQVIISTHSPLLVNRTDIARNVIVDSSQAVAAKNVSEIRKVLGVQIADNLQSANLIILAEGRNDTKKLKIWLSEISDKIKNAIKDGIIGFDDLAGGNNLSYKASLWRGLLCDVFVFLDNDKTGNDAFLDAKVNEEISLKNTTFATLDGYRELEMEDLILPQLYVNAIKDMGVDLNESKEFKNSDGRWSVRMRNAFKAQGKIWNQEIADSIKEIITDVVSKEGINSIHPRNRPIINKFAADLENYIESRQ